MNRITLDDSTQDIVVKMADGNPGALTVLMSLIGSAGDVLAGGLVYACWLDDLEIYGSDIWLAYKDVCGEDIPRLCEMLRHDRRKLKAAVLHAKNPTHPTWR